MVDYMNNTNCIEPVETLFKDVVFQISAKLSLNANDIEIIKAIITDNLEKYDIRNKVNTSTTDMICNGYDNNYLLNIFLSTKRVEGKSEKTIKRYYGIINNMLIFLNNKPISTISTNDIRYFLSNYCGIPGKTNSKTTIDGMRRIVSSFFNWLEIEDYIEKSPTRKLTKIKNDTELETPYTSGEIESMMINATHIRDKAIIQFLYSTACRVSELCTVKINDINMNDKTVLLHGKGNKDRLVPLDDKTIFYINKYMTFRQSHNIYSDYLFVSKNSPYKNLSSNSIRRIIKQCGKTISHPHPHRFRVTRITVLLKRGMKIEDVQVIAGHNFIQTTSGYNRIDHSLVYADFIRKG